MEDQRNKNARLEDILAWQRDHDIKDDKRFADLNKAVAKLPCHEDIKAIVDKSIQENFTNKGAVVKNWIVTAAVIVGAITTIAFGLKSMLAWIGINITR